MAVDGTNDPTLPPTLVIKLGGEVLAGDAPERLAPDLRALLARGAGVVLVHGGGPQVSQMQARLGLPTRKIGGRRVTDDATLDVLKMVVAGRLNADLCARLSASGVPAVGLSGASAHAVLAKKRPPGVVAGGGPEPIDFGHVGDVVGINARLFETLLGAGFVPVVACLGASREGALFNINADTVANQLSAALCAAHLFLVTYVVGVLRDVNDPASRIERLSAAEARRAIADGTIQGGMVPKVEEALAVLQKGVGAIHIVGEVGVGDLVRELVSAGAVGTALTR